MEKLFYLYGFFYIAMYIQSIYSAITYNFKKRKEGLLEMVPDKITTDTINKSKESIMKEAKGGIFSLINTIADWIWIIIGVLYMPETNLFYLLLFITIFSLVWTLIYAIYMVIKNKHILFNQKSPSIKSNMDSIWSKVPDTTVVLVIERTAHIIIAGYILYIHFYI